MQSAKHTGGGKGGEKSLLKISREKERHQQRRKAVICAYLPLGIKTAPPHAARQPPASDVAAFFCLSLRAQEMHCRARKKSDISDLAFSGTANVALYKVPLYTQFSFLKRRDTSILGGHIYLSDQSILLLPLRPRSCQSRGARSLQTTTKF